MAIPPFNFEQVVSSAGARHDKVEVEVEGRLHGDVDDVSSFVDYLGSPPENLRNNPQFLSHGAFFKRPESLEPPFRKQELRRDVLRLGNENHPPPIAAGYLEVKHLPHSQWRLLLLASLNPTRFVRHQPIPPRLTLFAGELFPTPNQFQSETVTGYRGEFSYCGNDNWIFNTPSWQYFASPTFWPRHLSRCLNTLNLLTADLRRAANFAQAIVAPAFRFNVRHVETYWEFLTSDPLGVVGELYHMVKLFSRRRVKLANFDVPPDFEGKENSLCLTLQTRVGEWTKIYAKTNRRIRIEVTHILTGKEGFESPTGRHTFATTAGIPPLLQSLTEIAAARVNDLLQHFQNHAHVPQERATLLVFIEQMQAGCQSTEIAHELLQILAHQGSLVVGDSGGNPLGSIFRDALRRLVRNKVLRSSHGRYSVTPYYKQALTSLRQRGMNFLLGPP